MKMKINILTLVILLSGIFTTSCQEPAKKNSGSIETGNQITQEEVMAAQKSWGEAIVSIGNAYTNNEDYNLTAANVVNSLYGYDKGVVLFKPTKASEDPFRLTKEEALSYFVTGVVPEDHGFALQPWSNVRFENAGVIIAGNTATAMGNYYFTDAKSGDEAMVEYTFGYFKDEDGKLRINVHHSSLPYSPAH